MAGARRKEEERHRAGAVLLALDGGDAVAAGEGRHLADELGPLGGGGLEAAGIPGGLVRRQVERHEGGDEGVDVVGRAERRQRVELGLQARHARLLARPGPGRHGRGGAAGGALGVEGVEPRGHDRGAPLAAAPVEELREVHRVRGLVPERAG